MLIFFNSGILKMIYFTSKLATFFNESCDYLKRIFAIRKLLI